jgi:DNA-binding winged helix-turn-helix (wHTH) protein
MELLMQLTSRGGQLVTRSEIAERLWSSEVFVDTEHGINTAIRKLRHLLRDDPDKPQFIQTVTGVGYRFVAPVTTIGPPISDPAPVTVEVQRPERPSHQGLRASKIVFATAAAALLLLTAVFVLRMFRGEGAASNPTLPHLAVEQRITENASDVPVSWPAISTDGKYLAYADPTGLYLRQISSGERRRLNLPKDFVAFPPGAGSRTASIS